MSDLEYDVFGRHFEFRHISGNPLYDLVETVSDGTKNLGCPLTL